MRKRFLACLSVLLLLVSALPSLTQAKAAKAPAAPVAMNGSEPGDVSTMGTGGSCGTPGTWYKGATPPNVDTSKPVLLFVHGKGSCAQTWWGETSYHGTNDMYAYAYNNGYRTAFVDLYGDRNMWDNGALLNSLINSIRSHFGVSKVTIIAHSKGGVDSNSAVVHYGAFGKVNKVITLGSPHWGTPLADLAYSSWAGWMADIFGQKDDGTYSMQTSYMEYFRSVTDPHEPGMRYRTLSGYKCGPVFTALWYGCMAISGEDDGVVPVWSTRIPTGVHLREGYWDHDEIKMGSRTWNYFANEVRYASTGGPVAAEGAFLAAAPGAMPDAASRSVQPPGNLILRGGEVTGTAVGQAFPIENNVASTLFTFYASSPDFSAVLTGPDGSSYTVQTTSQVPADQVFGGAYVGSVEVKSPAPGEWSLTTAAAQPAAYLMIASLDSDLTVSDMNDQALIEPGGHRTLRVKVSGRAVKESRATGEVSFSGERPHGRPTFGANGGVLEATVEVPARSGIHNVTINVTGTTEGDYPFERTLVTSFAAVAKRERGSWKR